MRFITEFGLDVNINTKKLHFLIPDKKSIRELGIGKEIGMAFGWQQNGKTTPEGRVTHHFSLEIEAFPMDKWVEFKQQLFSKLIDDDYEGAGKILEFIKELESFGKPAGAAKET